MILGLAEISKMHYITLFSFNNTTSWSTLEDWEKSSGSWLSGNEMSCEYFLLRPRYGTIHLRCWQIFMIFDPYPTAVFHYYPSAILPIFDPSPLKNTDVLMDGPYHKLCSSGFRIWTFCFNIKWLILKIYILFFLKRACF